MPSAPATFSTVRRHARQTRRFLHEARALSRTAREPGPAGNYSMRMRDGMILITGTGATLEKLTARQIALIDDQGRHLKGARPSSDSACHVEMYSKYPEAQSIYHTHNTEISLAALRAEDIPPILTIHADFFGRPIQYAPFSNHTLGSYGHPRDSLCIKPAAPLLLGRHGGLVLFGPSSIDLRLAALSTFVHIVEVWNRAEPGANCIPLAEAEVTSLHDTHIKRRNMHAPG